MTPPTVWVGADAADACAEAARRLAAAAREAIAQREHAFLALAGGRTPQPAYTALRAMPLAWNHVHVVCTDERAVPPTHPDSNLGMLRRTLLDHVEGIHVHPMHGDASDLDAEAARAAAELEAMIAQPPVFDAMLLGLGDDGHTASLFPGHPALDERNRSVVAVRGASATVADRLTLTLPVLRAARLQLVLATGPGKADAVRRTVAGDTALPIVRATADCPCTLLLDPPAATML